MKFTFDEACENVDARQAYLDAICLEGTSIPELSYISEETRRPFSTQVIFPYDRVKYITIARTLPNRVVQVFSDAFKGVSPHRREDDFLSTILDHEGFHARSIAERPFSEVIFRLRGESYFNYLSSLEEVFAYKHQLSNPLRRDLSPEYVAFVIRNLEMYMKLNRECKNRLEDLKR